MRSVPATVATIALLVVFAAPSGAQAEEPYDGSWEITPESEAALAKGLEWLAKNQGPGGDWENMHSGLISMGALAYMSAGHTPGRSSRYGDNVKRALDRVIGIGQVDGLLDHEQTPKVLNNSQGHAMYNHGLSTFVLGQAYGMTPDKRLGRSLDGALKLICDSQCGDGGWGYQAKALGAGHDLSLVVMQSKALRSAMDSGFKIPPEVINKAVDNVRRYYLPEGGKKPGETEEDWKKRPGYFSYQVADKGRVSIAMTAAGIVCLQEFGQYNDWRIEQAMLYLRKQIEQIEEGNKVFNQQYVGARVKGSHVPPNHVPFDAYTLYYVGQAIYQRGGKDWKDLYPIVRDQLVKVQAADGSWQSTVWWMKGKEAQLYGTAIACFYLSIPNRYLPILQEGRIKELDKK